MAGRVVGLDAGGVVAMERLPFLERGNHSY